MINLDVNFSARYYVPGAENISMVLFKREALIKLGLSVSLSVWVIL